MFIDVVENLCKSKGTTITAVCRELGISTSKPTSWRNGSTPNAKYVVMFAHYFNVTTDFLLEIGGDNSLPENRK